MSELLQSGKVHVDRHLTNVALNYRPSGFIAADIAPIVPVMKRSDSFINYTQADMFRREDAQRNEGDEAKVINFGASSDFYNVKNYALKFRMTLETELNRDPEYRMLSEENRTRFLVDKHLIDWETRIASLALNTANVGSTVTINSAWTDATNSRPVTNIMTVLNNFFLGTGYKANRMLFGYQAWNNFIQSNQVRDGVMNPNVTGGGQYPVAENVARYFGMDRVIVAAATRNTADVAQTQTLNTIWGDNVLVYYAPPAASVEFPSWMYSFRWNAPGLPNMTVERHPYDPKRKIYEVEVGYYQDEKITNAAFCNWIRAVNSSQ
jgi:hypothetical protein